MVVRMPKLITWLAAAALLALAVPIVFACVIPRTLSEQMNMAGDEVVVGTVQSFKEVTTADADGRQVLWTVVDFRADESLRSGKKAFDVRFFFIGGVTPGSQSTSITPSPDDIRAGRKLLLFLAKRPFGESTFGPGALKLDSYAECYRLFEVTDQGPTRRVVLGKGNGFAFPENLTVDVARTRIAEAVQQQRKK